jgi:sortase A
VRSRLLTILAVAATAGLVAAAAPAAPGQAQPRIVIPRLGLNAPLSVVPQLDHGPGFYQSTHRPGGGHTIAIAGHRTTHTRPFWGLDDLRRGDLIVIDWHGKQFEYRVSGRKTVSPYDWSIVRERGYERVVLTSCTPRFTAKERLAVFALPVHPPRARAT